MAAKRKGKGRVVAIGVVNRAKHKGEMLYVDADGNVRAAPRKVGGTKGAKRCKR